MQSGSDLLFAPFLPKSRSRPRSVVRDILRSEVDGGKSAKLRHRISSRRVYLSDIIPAADVETHVFLGFTQDGQFLISYKIDSDVLTLYVWLFRMREKLLLHSSHAIFRWSVGLEDSSIQQEYYDSTALTMYQWPGDDQHLLLFVVPDHPIPAVITVSVIFLSRRASYILDPGPTAYSVVGWGQRYKFIESKDKLGLEEVLTPGIVFCHRDHCTFHTGSEIVALSIIRPAHCASDPDSSGDSGAREAVESRLLDVERYLGDLIECGPPEHYVRLLTYELFVFGIRSDSGQAGGSSSLQVDAFVHAVVQDHCDRKPSFREFTLKWNAITGSFVVNQGCEQEKENSDNAGGVLSSESTMVPIVFRDMVRSYYEQKVYFLDNQQLVDVQLSLETMSSPTDSTIIELNCFNHSRLSL